MSPKEMLTPPCWSALPPVVIDMDGRIYVRPWQGGLLSGGFEKNPKPIFTEGRNQLEIQNMQEDWDHFGKGGRGQKRVAAH